MELSAYEGSVWTSPLEPQPNKMVWPKWARRQPRRLWDWKQANATTLKRNQRSAGGKWLGKTWWWQRRIRLAIKANISSHSINVHCPVHQALSAYSYLITWFLSPASGQEPMYLLLASNKTVALWELGGCQASSLTKELKRVSNYCRRQS